MPFYFRKSISVGPVRFNLSKSGIGLSVGIKGLRIGSGARGNYVHAGRGGIYYRAAIPGKPVPTANVFTSPREDAPRETPGLPNPSAGAVQYESGSALTMIDASANELLTELNRKRNRQDLWPIIAFGVAAISGSMVLAGLSAWICAGVFLIGSIATYWAYERDQIQRLTISMYDLDDHVQMSYGRLCELFEKLSSSVVWHIASETLSTPESGGRAVLDRSRTSIGLSSGPAQFRTNIPVPQISVGRQTLYFLPERVLIEAPEGFGTVKYSNLNISVHDERFVETDTVPPGANVVGRTWQHQKQNGMPDLRFSDNRELPIILYDRIHFKSDSGLNEVIQIAIPGQADELRKAIVALA